MRAVLGTVVAAVFLLAARLAGQQAPATKQEGASGDPHVKVVEITAKKYEYTPNEIHVKKGTRVQLKLRALDRTHGFKLSLYPDGEAPNGTPGLRFDQQQEKPQDNWKIEKEQERVIEFVAERPGT
jgi:plastocyanin